MRFDVSRVVADKHFYVDGMSYIGQPRPHTSMYITKKVESLLPVLETVSDCLVFAETGIEVSAGLIENHAFCFSDKPQFDYAKFANQFAQERAMEEQKLQVHLVDGKYYLCDGSMIGEGAYIEPGCFIGPDVQIGRNACILAGTVIRHTTIGDNFLSNEYAVIGANGFTMAEDENGNKLRIPTLGRVVIGNNVEIGAHNNVSCGSGGDTIIENGAKLDALVHIGHDAHICDNVEITAGGIIGGFDIIGSHAFIGINSVLRNRITIGANAVIGMGATVTKSVDAGTTVAGNPAKPFKKEVSNHG